MNIQMQRKNSNSRSIVDPNNTNSNNKESNFKKLNHMRKKTQIQHSSNKNEQSMLCEGDLLNDIRIKKFKSKDSYIITNKSHEQSDGKDIKKWTKILK